MQLRWPGRGPGPGEAGTG